MDKDHEIELKKGDEIGGTPAPGAQPPPTSQEETPGEDQLRESKLISFGDRITYTFIWAKEVHSIHFDRKRDEIFYRGHNIKNLEMTSEQIQLLIHFKDILSRDPRSKSFLMPYDRILQKLLKEKGYRGKV